MTLEERVPLSSLTTLKVGGEARYVLKCANATEVREALAFARDRTLPFYVLGEGSNVQASDDGYEGCIIRITNMSLTFEDDSSVVVGAGFSWDTLVHETGRRGLWGIENLAGIPGTVGAAPVQNIGAYGAELSDTFLWLEAIDASTGKLVRLAKDECGFGYRDSRFKREPELIIVRVAFALATAGHPMVSYPDLARLTEAGRRLTTPEDIADAVREVRSRKFPDLRLYGTAGSFFKNPVITEAAYDMLAERLQATTAVHGPLPRYPQQESGMVKIPLAYVLDKVLGLRGYSVGNAHLFENQPLVLVTELGATAHDVDTLANEVARRVHDATGITIEREVRSL